MCVDVELDVDVDCNKEYNNIKELCRQLTTKTLLAKIMTRNWKKKQQWSNTDTKTKRNVTGEKAASNCNYFWKTIPD